MDKLNTKHIRKLFKLFLFKYFFLALTFKLKMQLVKKRADFDGCVPNGETNLASSAKAKGYA